MAADVGRSKVECCRQFIQKFNTFIEMEIGECLFDAATGPFLLGDAPDFVVDCIDHVPAKVELLRLCKERHLPVISSGGAAARLDACQIRIDDLESSYEDELCRAVRNGLRSHGIKGGIPTCFSAERTAVKIIPLLSHQTDPEEYRPLPTMRVRTVPVVGTQPAAAGQAMAAFVLGQLTGWGVDPSRAVEVQDARVMLTRKNWIQLLEDIKQRKVRGGACPALPRLDATIENLNAQLSYRLTVIIFAEVYRGQSVLSVKRGAPPVMQLVPWIGHDEEGDDPLHNLVLMTRSEAARHFREGGGTAARNEELWGAAACATVRKKQAEACEWLSTNKD
eukprot:GHVU01138320.1.p1 GENE.GHVU01138320.1~~GHVU01138320.1.p1  ORF type:complete len:335 (+),score=46.41 GHVU01138320.1:1426-2430(+)